MCIRAPCPLWNRVPFVLLSCKRVFSVFQIGIPSSDRWLANIFSRSVSCLFTFLWKVSFEAQKIFMMPCSFSRFSLVLRSFGAVFSFSRFSLVPRSFGAVFKKLLRSLRSQGSIHRFPRSLAFYSVSSYYLCLIYYLGFSDTFWVNFCTWCELAVRRRSFAGGRLKRGCLFPMGGPGTLVKEQLATGTGLIPRLWLPSCAFYLYVSSFALSCRFNGYFCCKLWNGGVRVL